MATYTAGGDGNLPDDNGILNSSGTPLTAFVSDPGAATMQVQVKKPGSSTWHNMVGGSVSDVAQINMAFHGSYYYRFNVSSYATPFTIEV